MEKIALTVNEAAAASPFGRSILYECISNGSLRAKKIGRRTFIMREDLEQFLRSLPDIKLQK